MGYWAVPGLNIYADVHTHVAVNYDEAGIGYKRVIDAVGEDFFGLHSAGDFMLAASDFKTMREAFALPSGKIPKLAVGGVLAFKRQEPPQQEIKETVFKTPAHIPIFKIDKYGTVTKLSKDERGNVVESKPLSSDEIRKISETPEKIILGGQKLVAKSFLDYREIGSHLDKAQKLMDLAKQAERTEDPADVINFMKYQKNLVEPEVPSFVLRDIGRFVTAPTLGIHYSKRDVLSKIIHVENNVFPMLAYRTGTDDLGVALVSPEREGQRFSFDPSGFISRDGPEGSQIITPYDKPLSGYFTESGKSKLFLTDVQAPISDDDLKKAIIETKLGRDIPVFNSDTGEFEQDIRVVTKSLDVLLFGTANQVGSKGSIHPTRKFVQLALLGENANGGNKDYAMLSPTAGPTTFR